MDFFFFCKNGGLVKKNAYFFGKGENLEEFYQNQTKTHLKFKNDCEP